jgi:hypothetical protein
MIDQYAYQCAAYGVQPDTAQYMAGWTEGDMEYRSRLDSGGSD